MQVNPSEHPFQRLLDAAGDAMLVADARGIVVATNAAAARLFGRDRQALRAMAIEDLLPERYRAAHRELRARYAQAPGVRAMGKGNLFRGLRADGAEFLVEASLGPLDHGEVLITLADVTERRRTEDALREREELLRLFIDNAPVALAMFDHEMRYLAASRRWLTDYGLVGQQIVGRSHDEVLPDIPPRWRAANRRGLAGEVVREEQDRFERADGTVQWLRWELRPWRAASDAIGGIVIFTEDITEQVQARRAIEESESRFRATFEQAAVGLAHAAPDGRWLRVNRKLGEIVGYRCDELLQRSFRDITHPDDLDADLAQLQRLLAGEIDHYALDKRFIRKDGATLWVRLTVSLQRRADGTPDYTIAVIEDIDERKRTEQTLRRLRGEIEQLLTVHIAAETAAAIAHELNQPLNAVASYTEAARRLLQSGNPKPERLMHALQESASQAQRAGRVVRELLEFLHRRETSTEAIDLNAVVQEALSIVEASGFDGFRALVNLAPDLKPVRANRLQVEKVMVNLLRNSVEAMRGAGIAAQQITISVSTAADGEMALVTVRDTGPGMDEAVARRVFDPFFTTKPEGVGMGLAISRALVQANGGTLWFDASAGAGATFHFTLPFAR